jgi:hypothetical protein
VEDGGQPGRYDTSSVTVAVLDANDNAPVFEHSPYIVRYLDKNIFYFLLTWVGSYVGNCSVYIL